MSDCCTEYAKSGRSKCRGCNSNIAKDDVRIGKLTRSEHFDGEIYLWHHIGCFFSKFPSFVTDEKDISGLSGLRWEDQTEIKNHISGGGSKTTKSSSASNFGSSSYGDSSNFGSTSSNPYDNSYNSNFSFGSTSSNPYDNSYNSNFSFGSSASSNVTEYLVTYEYATSDCADCAGTINSNDLKVGTHVKNSSGLSEYSWYHCSCFKGPSGLDEYSLDGYSNLRSADKQKVRDMLKGKLEKNESSSTNTYDYNFGSNSSSSYSTFSSFGSDNQDFEKKFTEQEKKRKANQIWSIKDRLKDQYKETNQLKAILKFNNQSYKGGMSDLLDRIADGELNGILSLCPVCQGHLFVGESKYYCRGHATVWQRCTYETESPTRLGPWQYPGEDDMERLISEVKQKKTLKRKLSNPTELIEPLAKRSKKMKDEAIFAGCMFYILGNIPDKVKVIDTIEENGGTVAIILSNSVTHVISTVEELTERNYSSDVRNAKRLEKPIIDANFVFACFSSGSLGDVEDFKIWKDDQVRSIGGTGTLIAKMKTKKSSSKSGGNIKPDSQCTWFDENGHIYENDGEVYAAMLSLTDLTAGRLGINSFYVIQMVENEDRDEWMLFTRWGRVGQDGSNKETIFDEVNQCLKAFKNKYSDKTKNLWENRHNFEKKPGAFYPVEVEYEGQQSTDTMVKDATRMETHSFLPDKVQELVKLIFDEDTILSDMKSNGVDITKMPLGKLSRTNIQRGMEVLEEIEQEIKKMVKDQPKILSLTNQYYTIIPHDFGFLKPPIIDTKLKLQTEFDLLSMLMDVEVAARVLESSDTIDAKYTQLRNDINPLTEGSLEWDRIVKYIANTSEQTSISILNIFKINRHGEDDLFKNHDHISERKLLWHGSCVSVFGAILSGGLKIMPHAGGRVGRGLYFADMISKSASYLGFSSGNVALILLNEVVIGKQHKIHEDDSSLISPPSGYDSVLAEGRMMPLPSDDYIDRDLSKSSHPVLIPQGNSLTTDIDSSFFHNEYVVYDQTQASMKYLLMIKIGGW